MHCHVLQIVTGALSVATASALAMAQVQSTDRLMSLAGFQNYQAVAEIDTATGQLGTYHYTGGVMMTPCGLAASGDWLYALSQEINGIRALYRLNPADGTGALIGALALAYPGNLCSHPLTGELFVWANVGGPNDTRPDLLRVDPQTAQTTLVLTDLSGFSGAVAALTIDNSGTGWFVRFPRTLYQLDLTTGYATAQGVISGLPNSGGVVSLAIAADNKLYAGFYVSTFSSLNGFYRIDRVALTATKIATIIPQTLAFAPGLRETVYCTAKTNSLGCVPSIGGHGYASVSADEGLDVWAENVLNETNGLLFFGVAGRYSYPWHGGTLCVRPPLTRTAVRSSGGDPWPAHNCSGRWALDFNSALVALPPLAAGTVVDLQWYGRDTGFAPPNNYQFTDALEFTLRP